MLTTYFIFVLILSIYTAEECQQLDFYSIYLTNWNVILNAASTFLGAIYVTLYYYQKIAFNVDNVPNNDSMPKMLRIYWLLSNLSTSVSIAVAIAYWPSYNGRDAGLNDVLTHAGNPIVLFADTFIHARPPRYGHFIYPLGFGFFYLFIFSVPYQLLGGVNRDFFNYIYAGLDWTNNVTGALTNALMLIGALGVVHCVVTFSITVRLYVHNKLKCGKGEETSLNIESNDLHNHFSLNP